jgi:ATP-dependent helicase/nuclease subunit B
MLPPLINIAPFRDAIENNRLILTANQRLAAQIQQAWGKSIYDKAQVWKAPRVMSLEHWLSFCWNELVDKNHTLVRGCAQVGRLQNLFYWEKAIAQHQNDADQSFATMANDCFDLLQRWKIEIDQVDEQSSAIYKFKQWAKTYQSLLDKNKLITTASTWRLVGEAFKQHVFATEPNIYLYGFQSIPPLQQWVMDHATSEVIEIEARGNSASVSKVECPEPTAELETAAKWAAQQLLKDPNQHIGLVVPDLNNRVLEVARIINEALASNNCSTAVNISAGVKLAETPILQSALALLEMTEFQLPIAQWLDILNSPYSHFNHLPIQFRVDCELEIRTSKKHEIGLDRFIHIIRGQQANLADSDSLQPQLQPLYDIQQLIRQSSSSEQSFIKWAEFFNQYTTMLGWPGIKQPSSLQYQQIQYWEKLLGLLVELDNLGIEVDRSKALGFLQKLANEQLFHPQTGDAPLQILGLLEAVGLQFDQLWITGMDNTNFPASGSMDPVLSASYQRRFNMPFSVPENELKIAQNLLSGFAINSKNLILSYPLTDGNTPLDQSPLIKQFNLHNLHVTENENLPVWLNQSYLCDLQIDMGYSFNAEKEPIRGGSSILKNQSCCPFNAFAIHRLWAKALEQPTLGLEAMDRGSIVHEILYRLWNQWEKSTVFCALSEQQLSNQLSATIDDVLTEQAPKSPILLGDNFRQLEKQRLTKIIKQWLEIERQRPPFEVKQTEQKKQLSFGELNISLIMDRMDTVNNETLVIDYKTGTVKDNVWQGDRPIDPQLPLYILASNPQPTGCAFALLKGNEQKYIGISKDPIVDGVKASENWQQQVEYWRLSIENLAQEFVEGKAILHCFNKDQFNYQTDLIPLNRWNEQQDVERLKEAKKVKYATE